jgi:hypothetical protein
LMIAATNGWFVGFDNISFLPIWLSDALCSLATGGGFSVRENYSDDQEILFDAKRPIMLNGIEGVAVRGDLLDRSLVVELPTITKRLREQELWESFRKAHPRILGALLNGIVEALKTKPPLTFPDLPRMADAACWAAAGVPAFGWHPESAIEAIKKTQEASNTVPLDASPVVPALRHLLATKQQYEGTATDLFQTLTYLINEQKRPKGWPSNPQVLSSQLRRIAPNLRVVGVEVTWRQETGAGSQKIIAINDTGGYFSDASNAPDSEEQGYL